MADYRAPKVEVGQVVLWRFGPGEAKPCPAVVTSVGVGGRTINCHLHVEGTKDHVPRSGVRHVGDPFLQSHPQHDQGCWDLTPRDRRLDALLADLEAGPLPAADEEEL